jgi:hypothetical protein
VTRSSPASNENKALTDIITRLSSGSTAGRQRHSSGFTH